MRAFTPVQLHDLTTDRCEVVNRRRDERTPR